MTAGKKAKARKKLADKRKSTQALLASFPEYEILNHGVPQELADAVSDAVSQFRLRHRSILQPKAARFLKSYKQEGVVQAASNFYGEVLNRETALQLLVLINLDLAEEVFKLIPEPIKNVYFPHSDVRILPKDNGFVVSMRSLSSAKTSWGRVYYSPAKPLVARNGKEFIVSFSNHAIERICERSVGNWKSHAGLGDAFAFFCDCVYFESWSSGPNEGFALWDRCQDGFFSWKYPEELLDKAPDADESNIYYLIGYCPAVENEELYVAKTLLLPGMKGTKEHDWYLMRHGSAGPIKKKLFEKVGNLSKNKQVENLDFGLLKEFHEAGFTQVKKIEQMVFDYSDLKKDMRRSKP